MVLCTQSTAANWQEPSRCAWLYACFQRLGKVGKAWCLQLVCRRDWHALGILASCRQHVNSCHADGVRRTGILKVYERAAGCFTETNVIHTFCISNAGIPYLHNSPDEQNAAHIERVRCKYMRVEVGTYTIGPKNTGTPSTVFSNWLFFLCAVSVGRKSLYHMLV